MNAFLKQAPINIYKQGPPINYTKLFQVGPLPRPHLKIRVPEVVGRPTNVNHVGENDNNVGETTNIWEVNTNTWGNMPIGNNYRNRTHRRYNNMRAFNKPKPKPITQLRRPLRPFQYKPIEVLNARKVQRTRNNRRNNSRNKLRNNRRNKTRNNHVRINVRRSRKNE